VSSKLIIPFEGRSKAAIESGGLTTYIGWSRFKKFLESSPEIGLSDNETITGLVIDNDGINIRLEIKPKP
jgi:hypothetical protein